MIYIFTGNDTKKKNAFLKKLYKDNQPIFTLDNTITKEILFEKALSLSLFGESPIVIVENLIKDENIVLSISDIKVLKESNTIFVFLEDKLLATESKKFGKYASIEDFSVQTIKQIPKIKVFDISSAFERRDKIGTWILYREAVLQGISPEEISGIIFWKIKTMLLTGTKLFSINELKNQSSEIVSIYHKSHRGEYDFNIGLEQFILSSLNKRI